MKLMKKGLSLKITVGLAGVLTLVLGAVAWVSISMISRQYIEAAEARAEVLARPLQERLKDLLTQVGFNSSVFIVLNPEMARVLKENSELSHVAAYDASGQLMAHTDPERAKQQAVQPEVQKALAPRPQKAITVSFGGGYHTLVPVVHENNVIYLSIGTRGDVIQKMRARIAWTFLVLAVAALLVGGAGALFLVRHYVSGPIGRLIGLAKDMAEGEGDLTKRLDVQNRDEIGELAYWFNTFVGKLQEVMIQVRQAADEVTTGSRQLSVASEQMSSGAQQQASSLEETAASLEEITGTVKQNAENAREANQLAVGSRDTAERGGEVVTRAVGAMGEINESSKKIADIITTIDEIAFQTNLLALNAAVEAARAGEQGRGFAVVAAEVRSLAQRSATAAKEIKALIQDSVQKVQGGSELVNESGQTLQAIVSSVKKVTDIIGEIAAASQEQSSGIDQVNKAITEMDHVVQSNAAQTEELSSTAQTLSVQAGRLQNLVGRFKVDETLIVPSATGHTVPKTAQPELQAQSEGTARERLNGSTRGQPGLEEF
jgi:methyl-accepting chemotaxis protein